MLSLSGCDFLNPGPTPLSTPYHGSEGLRMEFHQLSPPESVAPGRPFNVVIYLTNNGASDIKDGVVYLTSIVEDDIAITGERSKQFNLYGRSDKVQAGERTVVSWDALASSKEKVVETNIGAAAEYSYTTNSVSSICIDSKRDTDTGISNIGKPCRMEDIISLEDQGAPVAVKKILLEIDPIENKIYFTIGVLNVGGGFVSAGSVGSSELNKLDAEVMLAGQALSCESKRITMTDDGGEIYCTGSYAQDTAYTTTLQIKLNYVYRQQLSPRKIEIKKSSIMS